MMVFAFLFIIAVLTQKGEGNTLRGLTTAPPCFVGSFVVYEFNADGSAEILETPSFDLDLTDLTFGKLNIFAEVTEGCQPKCVKLSLAGDERKELVSPYALYGDVRGKPNRGAPRRFGKQQIKACLYTDRACTKGEYGCLTREVDIIPANEPLEAGPFALEPFSVTLNGVDMGTISEEETKVAAETICQVITEFWGFGAFYRCDVGVSDFDCVGVPSSTDSTTIEFTTSASVSKSVGFNPYCNRRLPDRDELFGLMTGILEDNEPIGPNGPGSLDYFVELLPSDNTYSSVTSFTVTV